MTCKTVNKSQLMMLFLILLRCVSAINKTYNGLKYQFSFKEVINSLKDGLAALQLKTDVTNIEKMNNARKQT